MSLGDPFDETVETEASQVVGHLSWSDLVWVGTQQVSQRGSKIFVRESRDLEGELDNGTEKRLDTPIIETQSRYPLSPHFERPNDSFERLLAKGAVVTDFLDVQETPVGLKADLP